MPRVYKFSERGPKQKPCVPILDKLMSDVELTRTEKNQVADKLYGTFSQHSSSFNYHGWRWVCHPHLKRILVRHRWSGWQEYYAPDKTSLRQALGGDPIMEMHYLGETDARTLVPTLWT